MKGEDGRKEGGTAEWNNGRRKWNAKEEVREAKE